MINIKKLSVGNWVKFPHGIDKITDLPYVEGKGVCASFAASATLFPVSMEKLEPIAITPEILKKNGFGYVEKDEIMNITHYYLGEEQVCKDMNLHIGSGHDGKYWLNYKNNTITPIFYVHQLQNALILCGIDKKIEL